MRSSTISSRVSSLVSYTDSRLAVVWRNILKSSNLINMFCSRARSSVSVKTFRLFILLASFASTLSSLLWLRWSAVRADRPRNVPLLRPEMWKYEKLPNLETKYSMDF